MQREAEHAPFVAWRQANDGATREQAFEDLFRQHYQRVYQVCYRLVGDEADDLAQEVFLKLYQRPPAPSADHDLAGWLYRVATRLGYNVLRGKKRWRHYRDDLGATSQGRGWQSVPIDPHQQAETLDTQQAVRAALARLKERDASLLVLRASGLSYRELADTLGLRVSSVGKMLSRAETAFRKVYAPDEAESEEDAG